MKVQAEGRKELKGGQVWDRNEDPHGTRELWIRHNTALGPPSRHELFGQHSLVHDSDHSTQQFRIQQRGRNTRTHQNQGTSPAGVF